MSHVRRRYALVVLILGCFAVGTAVYLLLTQGIRYQTIDLPSIDPSFRAQSLNDRGQIVLSSPAGLHVWDPNTGLRDVGVIAVTYPNHTVQINNAGQLGGGVLDPNGFMQAFFWDPNTGLRMLGAFGEKSSWALDINSKGQVVGCAGPQARVASNPKAFLWSSSEPPALLDMHELGSGGPSCINDQMQVAGFMYCYGQPQGFFAFRWDPTGAVSTHLIGNPMTGTVHIDGQGSLVWARPKEPYVMIWGKEEGERQIPLPADAVYILGVNERGQILARASRFRPASSRSWFRSVLARFLPSREGNEYWLCDPPRRRMQIRAHARQISPRFEAVALNNRGWILGRDYDRNDTCRWLILKPIGDN